MAAGACGSTRIAATAVVQIGLHQQGPTSSHYGPFIHRFHTVDIWSQLDFITGNSVTRSVQSVRYTL